VITLQERVHSSPPPGDWSLNKLHRVLRVRKGFKNTGMQEDNLLSLSYGRIIQKSIDAAEGLLPESFETYQIVEPGNIVMRLTDLQNDKRSLRQGLVRERGIITSAYDALEIEKGNDPRFWAYALLALDLAKYYYSLGGGVRQSIKFSDFPNDWIATPDTDTQKAIADFLDRETAHIDQLIEKKQRLVKLIRERSLSAIEKAVTADASLSKLGHHVRIIPGYAFPSSEFTSNEEDIRLLRGANVSPGKIRWEDVVYWPKGAANGLDRFQLEVGDIAMGMDRPWISGGIRVAEIKESDVPALLLQRVCKIVPLKTLSKEFLKILLSSKKFLGYFEPELTGVSVPHISGDQIAGFRFPYFPVSQQDARATACHRVLASNDLIIERAQQSIRRLHEFRSALITAAVTGQIDVATWGERDQTDRRLDQIEEEMAASATAPMEARA
jgi:type I restriction enzyme S subunit